MPPEGGCGRLRTSRSLPTAPFEPNDWAGSLTIRPGYRPFVSQQPQGPQRIRLALWSWRWLLRILLLLVVVGACIALGIWQWSRAMGNGSPSPPSGVAPLVSVQSIGDEVSAANTGRTVRLTGRFDPSRQVIVPNRINDGQPGFWVVTAFDFRASSESNRSTRVPVVRGWLPSGQSPSAPPR